MSKRRKLVARLYNNPYDATFADVRALLEAFGFVLDRTTGSHHIFERGGAIFVLPVHNNRVKSVYVRRALQIIEQLENRK